ncbi:MAG: CoA transferase [Hydrogenophaga sp.]|jgi:crotonobetainyl-CoA:carnitine CoA-transferase CaiB-like acyl-CoA transferase|uniref:CaiB/BaiF CoA transferase family protein n=1 Tax=Hydrogenophaga sp. TaxID=1904254 RepID=UPI0027281462|nr:CoA transferase [Hydrogenophaga sp.]MDO9029981.1 CoA transferase [Hydrogenophaga sp.]
MNFEPMKGVRVLDLTSVVVGPVCTWRLGQYGAEVIKVENPEGDLMRGLGGQSPTGQHSGTYLHLNRGKRNICLDLKKPSTRKVMQRLIEAADVIVANMRPQALERLGLDAVSIRAQHPEKIYCLITGYGTDGPYAGLPTYDSVVQGATGMAGLTLRRDGTPNYVPMLICDHVAGEIAAGAILAAMVERRTTGKGCSIEVPMFETMAAFVMQEHLAQHSFDPPVGPPGDLRLLSPHNRPIQTANGWISFTVNTDPQVKAFLRVTGRDDLLEDPRFNSVAARAKNVKEWFEIRGASLTSKSTKEWVDLMRSVDIAVQPCNTLESLPEDEHLQAVGLVSAEQHPTEGKVAAIRSTIRFDDSYPPLRSPSQPKGWETRSVLLDAGYSPEEVEALISDGAAIASGG